MPMMAQEWRQGKSPDRPPGMPSGSGDDGNGMRDGWDLPLQRDPPPDQPGGTLTGTHGRDRLRWMIAVGKVGAEHGLVDADPTGVEGPSADFQDVDPVCEEGAHPSPVRP